MRAKGQRKVAMLQTVLYLSLIVVLVLAAATIWGDAQAVAAAVGPIALMWGGVASAATATFNVANAMEHSAAAKTAAAAADIVTGASPAAR